MPHECFNPQIAIICTLVDAALSQVNKVLLFCQILFLNKNHCRTFVIEIFNEGNCFEIVLYKRIKSSHL